MDEVVTDPRHQQLLNRVLGDTQTFVWGMAPNKHFVGTDFAGFPSARFQKNGFREIVLFKCDVLAEGLLTLSERPKLSVSRKTVYAAMRNLGVRCDACRATRNSANTNMRFMR